MEVVYYAAMSMDGFIATPEGQVDWLSAFEGSAEDYGYAQFLASVDVLFSGSLTYEFILSMSSWPYPGKPYRVFSHRSLPLTNVDVEITAASPAQVVNDLSAQGFNRAWLIGGSQLATSFRNEGLINRYIISIIPIVLGQGIPLLYPSPKRDILHLVRSQYHLDGVVQVEYLAG